MNPKTLLSLAVFALSGCATVQLAPDHLAANEASIRGAEEVGALGVPSARLHLELAKDETASAKKLAEAGDDRAPLMLARANADAELALGEAREIAVHTDALRAAEDLKAVQARGTP